MNSFPGITGNYRISRRLSFQTEPSIVGESLIPDTMTQRSAALEKFHSVIVELECGERKTLPVRGASSGAVFQQVKSMPGIRRVGRVAEVNQAAFEALVHVRAPAGDGGPAGGRSWSSGHRKPRMNAS